MLYKLNLFVELLTIILVLANAHGAQLPWNIVILPLLIVLFLKVAFNGMIAYLIRKCNTSSIIISRKIR